MRSRGVLILGGIVAVSLAMGGAGGTASAGSDTTLPKGPSIDFCPTADQIEAHLAQYGFDYKPTVPCGEQGVAIPGGGTASEILTDAQVEAHDRVLFEGAKRAPDTDGDPATMEVVLQDGTTGVIFINTGNPEHFRDMTPEQFIQDVYGDK